MLNIMLTTVRTVWREQAAVCLFCLGDLLRESDGPWRAAGTEGDDARRCPSPDACGHVHAGASCRRCGKALVPNLQASADVWFARYPLPGRASGACGDDGAVHEVTVD